MPGRRGVAWGNALGGWKKQPRVAGRFVSMPNATKVAKRSSSKAIRRRRTIKRAAIAGSTIAVVGGAVYAHQSGMKVGLVKTPTVAGSRPRVIVSRGLKPTPISQTLKRSASVGVGNIVRASHTRPFGVKTGPLAKGWNRTARELRSAVTLAKTRQVFDPQATMSDNLITGAHVVQTVSGAAVTAVAATSFIGGTAVRGAQAYRSNRKPRKRRR